MEAHSNTWYIVIVLTTMLVINTLFNKFDLYYRNIYLPNFRFRIDSYVNKKISSYNRKKEYAKRVFSLCNYVKEVKTSRISEIIRRFAEEFLSGEFEGVFSVHTNKAHPQGILCPAVLIWLQAGSFEKFIFLMEKLGYEVKIGVHISVKAEAMRQSRRLNTLDEEFLVQNLQAYYERERPYKYVEPPVYSPGYVLRMKPANAFQQRYYVKMYRMYVMQKCRLQHKYTRYQQGHSYEGAARGASVLEL